MSLNSEGRRIEIEDDTLREGLQSVSVRRPTQEEIFDLIRTSHRIGVEHIMLGFPAVSENEISRIGAALGFIKSEELRIFPWVLSRLRPDDARKCLRLQKQNPSGTLGIAVFRAVSKVREKIEGINRESFRKDLARFMDEFSGTKIPISFNLEDVTRAEDQRLAEILRDLKKYPFESVALCDTVGIGRPDSVRRLVLKVREILGEEIKLVWHGHNDLGLAHANSVAALDAGADIISGTFLGVGERAGNSPLEQMLLYLNLFAQKNYDLRACKIYCEKLTKCFDFQIPPWTPVVGKNIHSTQAGTHIAAILKSKRDKDLLAEINSEMVFAAFPPEMVGNRQDLVLGPLGGLSMARHILEYLRVPVSDSLARGLLEHAKGRDRAMSLEEVQSWLASQREIFKSESL